MTYTPADAITYLVDPEALAALVREARAPGARVALVGFNEYSKNVINLAPEAVVGIHDRAPWMHGIRFRGVPVVPLEHRTDATKIIHCAYEELYEASSILRRTYGAGVSYYYPPKLAYKSTDLIDVAEQEALYRRILEQQPQAPASMVGQAKVKFLLEVLRQSLRNPGAVVEMGVWQGGTSWYMAKLLKELGESRELFMVDLFETHAMDRTATMCNDEISRRMAFYPPAQMLIGLVDDPALLARIGDRPLSFAHFDLGFIPKALEFLWDRLQPGSFLLLDNYGHLAGDPWAYDEFFAARGRHVVRFPWSEQGLVVR